MAGLRLREKVTRFLKDRPEQKFTAREMATWIAEAYPDACRAKMERSENLLGPEELVGQLVAEIGANRPAIQKKTPQIKTTEERPRRYYFTIRSDAEEVEDVERTGAAPTPETTDAADGLHGPAAADGDSPGPATHGDASGAQASPASKLSEHDLYPMLSEYLWAEFGIYSRRIDERRASNRRGPGGNKWLYPDVVGMEDLSGGWHREIKDCVREHADKRTKLWSFEVKLLVNRSNVRECFFQTVSNSSWGHYGYLVAAEIEGGDTIKELRMLFAAHGIGVIRLDKQNPAESEILIPARERGDVDWDNANRLAQENSDFLEVIKLVRQFYQTGDPRPSDWDLPVSAFD